MFFRDLNSKILNSYDKHVSSHLFEKWHTKVYKFETLKIWLFVCHLFEGGQPGTQGQTEKVEKILKNIKFIVKNILLENLPYGCVLFSAIRECILYKIFTENYIKMLGKYTIFREW